MNTTTQTLPGTPMMRAIAACVSARVPALLIGAPGQGKTAKLEAMSRSWGYYFESLTGSNREATDFLGLPFEGQFTSPHDGSEYKVQSSLSLDWAIRLNEQAKVRPNAGSVVLLDECNLQEDVMKAFLRVTEERIAGPDRFEDNVAVLLAMNPTHLSTGGYDLPAPFANRMIHLTWEHDHDAWTDAFLSGFADVAYPSMDSLLGPRDTETSTRVRSAIAQFLNVHPQHRNDCPENDIDAASGPWQSIRMWTKAAQALEQLHHGDDAATRLLLRGAVGKKAATDYMTWRDQQDLYDPAAVLRGDVDVNWNDGRLDRLYVLTLSLRALVQATGDADQWATAMKLMAQGQAVRPDVAWQGAHGLLQVRPSDATLPRAFKDAFSEQMDRVGLTTSQSAAA
ncbi:hypothetical protein [Ornithinimicrobium murale]|uniref:hypothetical protein n=1 Tax=Ornithinimicrobium murale TaxID=1050153 RepID=UPI0013B359E4|nr:hypothetical protein [Ornithinimicrobium murale]